MHCFTEQHNYDLIVLLSSEKDKIRKIKRFLRISEYYAAIYESLKYLRHLLLFKIYLLHFFQIEYNSVICS